MRRERFLVSEETLGHARSALAASQDSAALAELPMAQFLYGFSLLLTQPTPEAHAELQRAERLARGVGDTGLQIRCLTYLTASSRLLGDLEKTKDYADSSRKLASSAGLREYVAAALANLAWLHLKSGRRDEAYALAREAMEMWGSLTLVFPFQWLALVPLLEMAVAREEFQEAAQYAAALLSPKQQVLWGSSTDALLRAQAAAAIDDAEGVRAAVTQALRYLRFASRQR
jgi:tetratricopeptide (TPR) repeat protein